MIPSNFQPLVGLKHHNIALLFVNYLQTLRINAHLEQEEDGYAIYCDPAGLSEAKLEFERFIKNPSDDKYQQAAWEHAQPSEVEDNSPSFFSSFKRQFLAHCGWVTLSIFIVCWLVFLATMLGAGNSLFGQLRFYSELSFAAILSDPLKLIGPALFHFSLLHIAFNTMWWWQLGGDVEKVFGSTTLLSLFLISAIVSNTGQFYVTGANFGGLSGVVYALFGYVWWIGWLRPETGLFISKPLIGFLLFWMVLGFADLLPVNMANMAHLLGLVSGCSLAWLKAQSLGKKKRIG